MKISILGTGNVAQTFATKFTELGHDVVLGTRNVEDTLNRANGTTTFKEWHVANNTVQLATFEEAVKQGEMVLNALQGGVVTAVIKSIDSQFFNDKIVIDISNPLDFSQGFPPSLLVDLQNKNSLGEEVQKLLPNAKVVKTLNTMYCGVMVNPNMLADKNHVNFISGNDAEAKKTVTNLLLTFGWDAANILDLGDITNARGTEGYLLLWIRIYSATSNGAFNVTLAK